MRDKTQSHRTSSLQSEEFFNLPSPSRSVPLMFLGANLGRGITLSAGGAFSGLPTLIRAMRLLISLASRLDHSCVMLSPGFVLAAPVCGAHLKGGEGERSDLYLERNTSLTSNSQGLEPVSIVWTTGITRLSQDRYLH